MKIKLSLGQIYRANDALTRFADVSNKFKINETFRIIKLKNIIQREYDLIEQQRVALANKFIPEGSNLTQVPADKLPEFHREFIRFLFSENVEIDIPEKISAQSIMDSDTIKVSPQDLVDIAFFIDGIENYIEIIDDDDKSENTDNVVDFTKTDNTE